jgi:hypothetical protein
MKAESQTHISPCNFGFDGFRPMLKNVLEFRGWNSSEHRKYRVEEVSIRFTSSTMRIQLPNDFCDETSGVR